MREEPTGGRHFCLLKLLNPGGPNIQLRLSPLLLLPSSYSLLFTRPGLTNFVPWPLLQILSIFLPSLYYVSWSLQDLNNLHVIDPNRVRRDYCF